MTKSKSLFARMLRNWRTHNGQHGRMTQEELADLLDVSVDAVGKYERSLSFVRGDLEPRLATRLGWSQADILACREDWQARQHRPPEGGYQILDEALVGQLFDGSWPKAIGELIATAAREFGELPGEISASEQVFLPIYDANHDHICIIVRDGVIVALWSVVFLTAEDEAHLRQGRLVEADFSIETLQRPVLPGTYYGYCPGLAICRGHEAAAPLMLRAFERLLEQLAEREILLHGLGTINVTPGGEQMCRHLGMTRLNSYFKNPDFGVWDLPGAAIARSIFTRRSPFLRRVYADEFNRTTDG